MPHTPFIKMHGIGNDFAVFDARADSVEINSRAVKALANRYTGIGFDQCIILRDSDKADIFMQIINADGGEVEACGNATRCVGWLLAEELGTSEVTVETVAGVLHTTLQPDGQVSVDMGIPSFDWQEIPLSEEVDVLNLPIHSMQLPSPAAVNIGNPHMVFFVEDIAQLDLAFLGPKLERHTLFPNGANISFAALQDIGHIKLIVWERGVGPTMACGTAACATHVIARKKELVGDSSTVSLPGGDLNIEWAGDGKPVMMTGPVALSYKGEVGL